MTEQIHCQVSTDAKTVLLDWQKQNGFRQQGAALENLLLKFDYFEADNEDLRTLCSEQREELEAIRAENVNHIDEPGMED